MRLSLMVYDIGHVNEAFRKRPLLIPSLVLLISCVVSFLTKSCVPVVILISLIFTGVLICLKRSKSCFVLTAAVFTCVLSFYVSLYISARLTAKAPSDKDVYHCVITSVSYDISGGSDIVVRLEGGAFASFKYYGKDDEYQDLMPGDELLAYGNLKSPGKAGNPGEFDYGNYLKSKGILYVLSCRSFELKRRTGFPEKFQGHLQKVFFSLRVKALDAVASTFDEDFRAFTAAVCLGDKSLIKDGIKRDFKMSCCSHLLAVSGTHFSGFLICLPVVLNTLKIKRRSAFVIHSIFCILIGCITGWGDSVTRAAIMSICMFAERDWLSALSLASSVMIIADPFCPMSSGFQMSFFAVIAIRILSGKLTELIRHILPLEKPASMIGATLAASIGIMPFWTDISMRPDVEHLVIQMAGSFLAGFACACFVPCVILCLVLPFLSGYLSTPLFVCLSGLQKVIGFGSLLSEEDGMPVHLSRWFLILSAVTVILFFLPSCVLKRLCLKLSCLLLAASAGFNVVPYINSPDCTVIFADVGQGDCCLVITPDKTCLIDAGTYEEGDSTVSDLLDYYGISQVDICIMSHWDVDHSGGIAALCVKGRTKTIYSSYAPGPDDTDRDVKDFFRATGLDDASKALYLKQLKPVLAGGRIDISDGVYIDVLYPSESTGGGNESSLVAMLHIGSEGGKTILFTGDIGKLTEDRLIWDNISIDCDILKVAHHGSKYSTSEEFIEKCTPDIAVISVGANNLYGHPAPQTLERLSSSGCELLRTDRDGAVIIEYRL